MSENALGHFVPPTSSQGVPYNMSIQFDNLLMAMPPADRERWLRRWSRTDSIAEINIIVNWLGSGLVSAAAANIPADQFERIRTQVAGVTTFLARIGEHAKAFDEDRHEEVFSWFYPQEAEKGDGITNAADNTKPKVVAETL